MIEMIFIFIIHVFKNHFKVGLSRNLYVYDKVDLDDSKKDLKTRESIGV